MFTVELDWMEFEVSDMWLKFWRFGLIRSPLWPNYIGNLFQIWAIICLKQISRELNSLCGRKGVDFCFHKSHSINLLSIITEHWLHKFGWLIKVAPHYKYSGLTISRHAERHALLEAAELAPVPVHSVHHAVLLSGTLVVCHTGLGPPEETLEVNNDVVDMRLIVMIKPTLQPSHVMTP